MTRLRWWYVAVGAALALVGGLVVLAGTGDNDEGPTVAALGVLAAFALFFFTVGRRGLDDPRWALTLQIAVIAATAGGTAISPNMATLQTVAYPLLWASCSKPGLLRPVLLSVLLAATVTAGFWFSLGRYPDALAQGAAIQVVSLSLGVGIGVWFTAEMRKGDENTRLLGELRAVQDQLAALHRETGATDERERLARELHDTIAQNLTSVVMLAQRGRNRSAGDVHDDFELIEQVAREALTETRALVAATAPVAVDGGLAAALGRLVTTFRRETGVQIATDIGELGTVPRELEVVLLRSAQEALANVRKHSGARAVSLGLHRDDSGPAGGHLTLTVRDDGVGIATTPADAGAATSAGTPAPADAVAGGAVTPPGGGLAESVTSGGFGLAGMQQRLALVGGSLEVVSPPGGGTTLTVRAPVPAPAPARAEVRS